MSATEPSWDSLDIDQLSVPERLDLITAIWDSIPEEDESLPLSQWHREELDRRLANRGTKPAISWEEVKARLRRKA
jgi:putative addiction module component (TIGR02574 family)